MANFTDSEIEGAVTKFVRNEVKTERTDLGPLSTGYSFDEVREFVASTLVFDPSAVFYLLSLAANRVNQDVSQALDYIDDVITAIDEVGRDTVKVTQTSLLEDAAAALLEVERVIETKNAITERPFNRYTQALDTFTSKSLTPNVRRLGPGFPSTYEIVRPPQKAQSSIKTNIAELRDLHEVIVSEARQLMVALSEFLAANLPLVSIQNSLPKVRNDLRSWKSLLDSATRDGAIELTRDVFLNINAGRSVITNLTTISDPREARMKSLSTSQDRATAYSDSTYPAAESTPAEVTTSVSAPYQIRPTTNEVRIEANGGLEQLVTLPVPEQGSISGIVGETFDIHDVSTAEMTSSLTGPYTVPSSPNNVFEVYADGIGYTALLTSGSRTATQVATEINAATRIDGDPGTFNDVGTAADDGSGKLKISHDTPGDQSIALGDAPALNVALGFTNEQSANGQDANNQIRFWVQDKLAVVINLTNGAARTAAQIAADIGVSSYLDGSTEIVTTTTGTITVVKVTASTYGEASALKVESLTGTQEEAAATLGFYEGQEGRGAFLKLEELYTALSVLTGVELDISRQVVDSGNSGETVDDGGLYKLRLPSGTVTGSPTVNDVLRISNGENVGWYEIQSISLGGAFDEIQSSRAFPAVTGAESQNQEWSIVRDHLTIRSTDVYTTSRLKVNSATANASLGLTAQTYLGSVSGVRIKEGSKFLNFSREDVVAGDRLTLGGPTYTTQHTVVAVTYDGYQIEVTPEVKNDLISHEYIVEGEGALAYATFYTDLSAWFTNELEPSKFEEDILELERTLNPLLVNKNPSAALVGTAKIRAQELESIYQSLSTVLAVFTTSPVSRIDALLDMLRERGMDRAHDLLLLGEFSEFFGATKDASSYGGNLLEKLRSIAQNDVPQGRGVDSDNADDRLEGSYDETDAEFDFSDQDDETSVREIDNIPDLTDDEDVLNRSL